ncbi:C-type mannose receptor 2-like [Antennarius striatus]|uniref:C-type mannose receptor 2-like n=1 Tax=Antennarius striatus TaxID=241820 RepID=UPI0035B0D865
MDGNLKKLLFFGTLCSVMKLTHQTGDIPVLHEFLSISGLKKTWTEAQEFCKAHYSELATVFNMEEVDGINSNNEDMPETLWIGLYDPIDSWTWTTEAMLLDFGNWEDGEPDNEESNEHCVVMTTQGFWKDRQCGLVMPFICYTGTGYMMVTEEKPHPEASIYCKEHHTYMATILNSDDNQDVLAIMQAYQTYQEAWIGLRRDNWKWIDDSNSLFRHWGPNQPDNRNNNEACAIVTPEGTWNDTKCNEEHGFICQEFTEVTPPNETTEAFNIDVLLESDDVFQKIERRPQ